MMRPDPIGGECMASLASHIDLFAADRVGPHHCGLFGRLAGSVPGFNYSNAMKNSKIVWNDKTLDRFLAKPLAVVPGSAMTYDGVPEPKDRADLIAYLHHANETPECGSRAAAKP